MQGLILIALVSSMSIASPGRAVERFDRHVHEPVLERGGLAGRLFNTGTTSLAARETAGPDTFVLYGGPDHPTQGKFQLANGMTPDWGGGNGLPGGYGGGPGAWTPVDLTYEPIYWHRSQFNAQTLGTNQPIPNHALWCGVEAGDPRSAGWATPPGYGNDWDQVLLYESAPLADASLPQDVSLDFYFHHELEPGYDYFHLEYDSAGTWISVYSGDDRGPVDQAGFTAPGNRFSDVQTGPIRYAGNDYGGDAANQIRIRMRVSTDGGWSDEDGETDTEAGAAQVDQITLTTSQGSFSEDFEGADPAGYLFEPQPTHFIGDFADVYARMTDIDECRENRSPVVGMIDYGQIVRNGPVADGSTTTGGSTSAGISYGVPGAYVTNYTGGLTFGTWPSAIRLQNEIWSPEILWDLPGTGDDGVDIAGARFDWDVWLDLPFRNGIFMVFHVRSARPGEPFGRWVDENTVYHGPDGAAYWGRSSRDVTDLLVPGPERVQLALGVWDYSQLFQVPRNCATPSPVFDNVRFSKYRLQGPVITASERDLAQDGFPPVGSIEVGSPAQRDALDIPFSMTGDVNLATGSTAIVPGDSILFQVVSLVDGAEIADLRVVWALQTNPLFEDALRTAPVGPGHVNVVAGVAGSVWIGEVLASESYTSAGARVLDTWFADLPDADFMYPGDVLHYYIQATDSDGRVSTLPHDTRDFLEFSASTLFARRFTVRGLPTITGATGTQPSILVWHDCGHQEGEAAWLAALQGLGLEEGTHFDTYTTMYPADAVSQGLGSAGGHGATVPQLDGYEHLIYLAGDLEWGLLSDGSGSGENDKGDDIGLLAGWRGLPGRRNIAHFGDGFASIVSASSAAGQDYVILELNVSVGEPSVRDFIDGQTAPVVVPDATGPYASVLNTGFVASGGCPRIAAFDQIVPRAGAFAGHLFVDPAGVPYPADIALPQGKVASVINARPNGYDVVFPIALHKVIDPRARTMGPGVRSLLLEELFSLFGTPVPGVPVVSAPVPPAPASLSVAPNPFNPSTAVKFTAAIGARGSVKVFNLRGELVTTLHDGEFTTQQFTWDGTDARGASVASGVYVVRATDGITMQVKKVALVK